MSAAANPTGTDALQGFDRTLLRGMFIVGIFAGITSIARVMQDAVIAWRYGAGPMADAYYFVVSLANWPVAVALSVFTLLVVPLEARHQRQANACELQRFRRELLGTVLLLAMASLPAAWFLLNTIAGGPLGGLGRHAANLAVEGIPAAVALVPLGLTGALFAAWLVAAGRHIVTLLEALPPLVLLVAVLLIPRPVLFWASSAGVALQVFAMAIALRAWRALPAPAIGFTSSVWRGVAGGALVLAIAQVISALLPMVDALFAARLGAGTLATLNFANRMVLGVQGLAGLALQRVGLPLLSRLVANSPGDAHRAVLRWAGIMGAAGLVIVLVMVAIADPLVAILFERGQFTSADRGQVVILLRWGLLQLVPFLAGIPVVTALASSGARGWLAVAAALGFAVKIGASVLLARSYGAVGLQVATALMYTAAASAAWTALNHCLRAQSAQHAA